MAVPTCAPQAVVTPALQLFVPVLASFVGGLMAIVAALIVHRFQAGRERQRRESEEREREIKALKDAYVKWFGAVTTFINKVGIAWIAGAKDQPATDFLQQLGLEPEILGAMVRLNEPDKDARERINTLVGEFPILIAKASLQEDKSVMTVGKELAAIMKKLAEFEVWLVETRFVKPVR